MKQYKKNVKNRNNLNMVVRVSKPEKANKLAIIQHGFSGSKDEKHLVILENKLIEKGYTVINFDATNSVNESQSSTSGITFTSHYNDLEDIINWAKQQSWYKEPFTLSGHSMGATSITLFAQEYPKLVNLLIPLSLAWGRGSSFKLQKDPNDIKHWQETGIFLKHTTRQKEPYKVPYSFLEDLETYDFIKNIDKITAKTILVIGDDEHKVRLDDNKEIFEKLTCEKELIILPNVPHAIAKKPEHEELYKQVLNNIFN